MATFHKTEETMKRVSNTILVFLKIPQISLSLYSIHYNFILEEGAEAFDSIIQKVFRQPSLFKNQLEKLEAARSAYLWLPLVTLLGITGPYSALLGLTRPY